MSTGFQIAGCVGSSVFTGIYAAVTTSSASSGLYAAAASTGMVVVGLLVGVVGIIGFACSLAIRSMATKSTLTASATQQLSSQIDVKHKSWEQTTTNEATRISGAPLFTQPTLTNLMQTDVFTLPTTATAADAMTLFATKGISGAPLVNEEGDLAGFVSDGDIMRNLADQIPSFKSAWSFIVERENADFKQTLSEVMEMPVTQMASKHVITVTVDDEMGEVARVLADNHLKKGTCYGRHSHGRHYQPLKHYCLCGFHFSQRGKVDPDIT